MKKSLLFFGTLLLLATGQKSNAQLVLENFNSGTLPPNWKLINDGHTVNSSFLFAAIQSALTTNAWIPYQVIATGDYSMLTTSYFNPAALADRWLITPSFKVSDPNTILTWDDYDLNSGENLEVLVSPTADTVPSLFNPAVYNQPAGVGGLVTHAISLSNHNGRFVRVAFRDHMFDGVGLIVDNVSTSILPNAVDAVVTSVSPVASSPFVYTGAGQAKTISGTIRNDGAQAITSFVVEYRQGTNPIVSETFTPILPIQPLSSGSFRFTGPFTVPASGSYPIKVWVTVPNDANHANDTSGTTIIGIDTAQVRMSMYEEFTGASCNPCAAVAPNVDSVAAHNMSRMNVIRYHVPIPARDLIYNVTKSDVDPRMSFYGITQPPAGRLNGVEQLPGASSFSSLTVDRESAAVSPFKIGLNASYNAATRTFTVNADIKSFTPFAAGLVAYAALTVDTIKYTGNISLQSIPQSVFPQSVVHMFPDGTGTALNGFTSGQTQTISASWVKDHPWGDVTGGFAYDSSRFGRITLWIQNSATMAVYQSASVPVSTIETTGVGEIIANNAVRIYPNPAKESAMLDFTLIKGGKVVVSIIDAAGRTVSVVSDAAMRPGVQHIGIPVSALAAGVYNVAIRTEQGTLTQRLAVVK